MEMEGIRSRQVETKRLSFHVLECGDPADEMVLLIHGFPELAYSWRKVMPLLAAQNLYVVAPDMPGYGRTVGLKSPNSVISYDDPLDGFRMVDSVNDLLDLLFALRRTWVRAVIGHDMGSSLASLLALARPDVVGGLVMMSAPFTGVPAVLPSRLVERQSTMEGLKEIGKKHYQAHFCTPDAFRDWHCEDPAAFREIYARYYHYKSARHPVNAGPVPHELPSWRVDDIKVLPPYYVMPAEATMETVVRSAEAAAGRTAEGDDERMTRAEMDHYVDAFCRTGIQGGLNYYRVRSSPSTEDVSFLNTLREKKLTVATMFLAGRHDWGTFQDPGALDAVAQLVQADDLWHGVTLIDGAGHWVQQERPVDTAGKLIDFILSLTSDPAIKDKKQV